MTDHTYPVQAYAAMWHAAADAIEEAADAGTHRALSASDAEWLRALSRSIREEIRWTQASALDLSITIAFETEDEADSARHYVRQAVDRQDHNE